MDRAMGLFEGQMTRTLGREVISTRQEKLAELAQMEPKRKLTTLAHHIDAVWMREASPVRPPVLGAFGRASQSAVSATSIHGHRDRRRRESWDMGPLGGCSDLPALR